MKTCWKCKEEKPFSEFCKNKRYKDGHNDVCKLCKKEQNNTNKTYNLKYAKKYNLENKEYFSKKSKEYYQNNIDSIKQYNKNRDKELIQSYNKNQIDSGYKKQWSKNKYQSDPNFKLSQLLRIRMLDALKDKKNKTQSVILLLGCSVEQLKQYLEQQFLPEMNWENHGKIWEIDHIKPCSSFDLTQEKQQQECFHYSNLQPLFKTTAIAESFGYKNYIGNRDKNNK
jgi:hypothetical protein